MAAIDDPQVIVKILIPLGLPTRAPPRAPAQRRRANRALPTAVSPEPAKAKARFFLKTRVIDTPPVRRYSSRRRKGCLNFLHVDIEQSDEAVLAEVDRIWERLCHVPVGGRIEVGAATLQTAV